MKGKLLPESEVDCMLNYFEKKKPAKRNNIFLLFVLFHNAEYFDGGSS